MSVKNNNLSDSKSIFKETDHNLFTKKNSANENNKFKPVNKKLNTMPNYCNTPIPNTLISSLRENKKLENLKINYTGREDAKMNLISNLIKKPFEAPFKPYEPNYNDKKFDLMHYKHEKNKEAFINSYIKTEEDKEAFKSSFKYIKYPNYLQSSNLKEKVSKEGIERSIFPNTYKNNYVIQKNGFDKDEHEDQLSTLPNAIIYPKSYTDKELENALQNYPEILRSTMENYEYNSQFDAKHNNIVLSKIFERFFNNKNLTADNANEQINNEINKTKKQLSKKLSKLDYTDLIKHGSTLITSGDLNLNKMKSSAMFGSVQKEFTVENSKLPSIVNKPKIKLDKIIFRNPIESHNALENNKKIENLYNYKSSLIQNIRNKHFYEKYQEMVKVNNFDSSHILVSNAIPKDNALDSTKKNSMDNISDPEMSDDEINFNKDNLNMNPSKSVESLNGREYKQFSNQKQVYDSVSIVNNHCTANYEYPIKLFPGGTCQFTLTIDKDLVSIAYLYGGKDSESNNSIWKLDLKSMTWKKLIPTVISSISQRYGHTTVYYQKKLFIFGGSCRYMDYYYNPDLEIYNLEDNSWYLPNCFTKSTLKLRKNHIAQVVGSIMLIHGGISEEGEYLNDTYMFSLTSLKWMPVSVQTEVIDKLDSSHTKSDFKMTKNKLLNLDLDKMTANNKDNPVVPPPKLAYHCSCIVLPDEIILNSKLNIYKFPDISKRFLLKYREKGIFVFGGKNSENNDDINSNMYVLRLGLKPLQWALVETDGKPPCPRYLCSMTFKENLNIIIIHGGKNDSTSHLNEIYGNEDEVIEEKEEFQNTEEKEMFNKLNKKNEKQFTTKEFSKRERRDSVTQKTAELITKNLNVNVKKESTKKLIYPMSLNDTFVLNLTKMEWIKVEFINNTLREFLVLNRYGHCSVASSDSLIIFGGMNESKYVGSSFFIMGLSKFYI